MQMQVQVTMSSTIVSAAKRAAKVVNELTTKYGIPADRITSDSKGARVQPFAENDKNRVSICIAE
jgi:OOP family OmpA-OmpF porin